MHFVKVRTPKGTFEVEASGLASLLGIEGEKQVSVEPAAKEEVPFHNKKGKPKKRVIMGRKRGSRRPPSEGDHDSVPDKVANYLDSIANSQTPMANTGQIALAISESMEYVSMCCSKLTKAGRITRPSRGLYVSNHAPILKTMVVRPSVSQDDDED